MSEEIDQDQENEDDIQLFLHIREIMYEQWDPNGIADMLEDAGNEYDAHCADIFAMCITGATKKEMADYLHAEAKERGAMRDYEQDEKIAELILNTVENLK